MATGVSPAMHASVDNPHDPTAQADLMAAFDEQEALALELRRSDGVSIETEDISIVDTEFLLSLEPDESHLGPLTPEQEAEIDAMCEEWLEASGANEPWRSDVEEETSFPRYQLRVQLIDHNAVP
jgi:hypothetical protein